MLREIILKLRIDSNFYKQSYGRFKEWMLFLFSILIIICFIFILGPLLDQLPLLKPIVQFIEENDIDAGALYYTEIEEFSTAEINMKNTMDYRPQRNILPVKAKLKP